MTLREVFDASRGREELALTPYLTGGYPDMPSFERHLQTAADAEADLIEVGIPFCDPIADGPTIQHSSQTALAAGATLGGILSALRRVRLKTPTIFMSYLNPLLAYGPDRLLGDMGLAGVRGLIVADLPVEESDEWLTKCRRHSIDLIFLAAPTSTEKRLREIAARATGFVYAVSRTGTTGAQSSLATDLAVFLGRIRALTVAPIAVGFGISNPAQVASLRGQADGVVIGSRLVEVIRSGQSLGDELRNLKMACRETA